MHDTDSVSADLLFLRRLATIGVLVPRIRVLILNRSACFTQPDNLAMAESRWKERIARQTLSGARASGRRIAKNGV